VPAAQPPKEASVPAPRREASVKPVQAQPKGKTTKAKRGHRTKMVDGTRSR